MTVYTAWNFRRQHVAEDAAHVACSCANVDKVVRLDQR